jgi:hypothetical protein
MYKRKDGVIPVRFQVIGASENGVYFVFKADTAPICFCNLNTGSCSLLRPELLSWGARYRLVLTAAVPPLHFKPRVLSVTGLKVKVLVVLKEYRL